MQILAEAEDLPKTANIRTQLVALWTTPVVAVILVVAFVAFPGFLPPMSPSMSAGEVAAFYADNTAMIRFSMITYNLCAIMLLPFFMVIVVQMKRMAAQSHALAYCYLTAVVSGATIFALANIFYLVAAYRPDRSRSFCCFSTTWPGSRWWPPSACWSHRTCSSRSPCTSTPAPTPARIPYSRAG